MNNNEQAISGKFQTKNPIAKAEMNKKYYLSQQVSSFENRNKYN
jgi:hypothetical protein